MSASQDTNKRKSIGFTLPRLHKEQKEFDKMRGDLPGYNGELVVLGFDFVLDNGMEI